MKTNGTPIGVVVATQEGRAEVSTSRRAACAGCAEANSCSLPESDSRTEVVTVRNAVGARAGDTVELDLPGNAALQLSFLVWVVPLLGLVGGAVVGAALPLGAGLGADAATLLGAFAGATLAYGALRRVDRHAAESRQLTPFIARVVRRVAS